MKILFVLVLLANIIVFLWEYNRGTVYLQVGKGLNNVELKQILLLSELGAESDNGSNEVNPDKIHTLSAFTILVDNTLLPKAGLSDHDIEKHLDHLNKKVPENSLKINRELKESEQDSPVKNPEKIEKTENSLVIAQKQTDNSLNINSKQQPIDLKLADGNQSNIKTTEAIKTVCYQVGPFAKTASVTEWRKQNKIDQDSFRLINKDKKVNITYLLYYPAAKTFSQSKENAEMLRQKGITDYWLFRKGESKGAISLGLFSKEKGALTLQKKLLKKGLKLEIKQRYKKQPIFFAQVLTSDQEFKDKVRSKKNQSVSECQQDREEETLILR
jgi:hypothetical protein